MNRLSPDHLGVCTWSLQPTSPDDLLQKLQAIGLKKIQIALTPVVDDPDTWASIFDALKTAGITIVSGMISPYGEDYTSLETIRTTGGVVPDTTWDKNWTMCRRVTEIAEKQGISTLTFHAGFIPHDPASDVFLKVQKRLGMIADDCAAHGITLLLETGQETAEDLTAFLDTLGRENVGVNFDPANMILYGKGDPIAALEMLMPRTKQVHLKDGNASTTPGNWGDEVAVGQGQVDWDDFISVLAQHHYAGHLVIEREAGDARIEDIQTAAAYISERLHA